MQNSESKYSFKNELVYCRHLRWHCSERQGGHSLAQTLCLVQSFKKSTLLTGAGPSPFPLNRRYFSFLQPAVHKCPFLILLQACWLRRGSRSVHQPVLLHSLYKSSEPSSRLLNFSQEKGWDTTLCWPQGAGSG